MSKLLHTNLLGKNLLGKTLCFLLFNLVFTTVAFGQAEAIIPSGNTANNPSDVFIRTYPFGNTFPYQKSSAIYLGSEINAAAAASATNPIPNLTTGTITHISYYLESVNGAQPTNVTIRLNQTAETFFPSNGGTPNLSTRGYDTEASGSTVVFTGTVTVPNPPAWVTIDIADFAINTSSATPHLEVLVESNCIQCTDAASNFGDEFDFNAKQFRFHNTGSNQFVFYSDANPPGSSNQAGEVTSYRPNIQLTITAASQPQTCDPPSGLVAQNITSSSADLAFTPSSTGAGGTYTVEYGPSGFTPGTGTVISGVTSSPVSVSSLSPNTAYQFYVTKNCTGGAGNSTTAGPAAFSTLAAPQTCDAPTGLSASNVTSTSADLNFTPSNTGASGTYTVEYGPSGFTPGTGTAITGVTGSPVSVSNLSPNTAYQFYVTKNCGGGAGNSTTAGPASFTTQAAPQTCDAPTGLSASNITTTSADLNFTPSATGASGTYTIEYGPTGFTPGTGTIVTGLTGSPYNATNLSPNTTYQFYVTKNCGGSAGNSTTAGPSSFTTASQPQTCDAPTNLAATNVTTNSATLTFTESTTGAGGTYVVQYGPVGFANGTGTTVSGPPYNVSGLTPGTTYDFTVQKDCGASGTSSVVRSQFTTTSAPQTCDAPTGLTASNITSTSASLNFTPSSTGAGGTYTVEYGPSGFTPGTGTVISGVTSSPVNVSNLTPNTAYQFYVTKNCTGGAGNSTTAGPAAFSTPAAPVVCDAPTNLNASNITNTTADLNFTPSAGAGTYTVEYGPNGFTQGTGTAVSGLTGSPLAVSNLSPNTAYQFYVQKDCGSGVTSTVAGPANFTTTNTQPATCDAPTNLFASNIGATAASLNFTPSATGAGGTYTLEYGPTGFTPGNGTVVTGLTSSPYGATNLLPNTTYDFYVRKDCGATGLSSNAGPATFTTLLAPPVCSTGTWLGITSTDWHTATNWCNNIIPDINTDVTIPALTVFSPVITANANARNLTIDNGATLTLTDGILTVSGLFVNNGTFNSNGGGSLAFTNNNPNNQIVGEPGINTIFQNLTAGPGGITLGGPVSIRELLTLNGNLNTNGQTFTLLSEPSNQAMVVNNSGVVNGTTIVQRYINPGINSGLGYRHLSSPVTNATIGQLNDPNVNLVVNPAYNTNPTPGTTRPFPTIFRYNETRLTATNPDFTFGWESPSSLGDPMPPGRGFTVNMPPTTVDISGTLNNGTVSVGTLTRGGTANSGWHLLGNPYPAPIDWDQVSIPSGMDNAVYVFRSTGQYAGSYTSYVNGVGTPGNDLIAVMQGFFVRVNSGAPSFSFNNSARVTTYQSPALYKQSPHETRPIVALSMQDNAGLGDQLHVYFENGATPNFDSQYDAFKLPNSGNVASFFSLAGNERLSINGLPRAIPGTVVPLGGKVPQAGSFTITADQILNFKPGQDIYLEDRTTGTLHNLRQQPGYQFTTSQTDLTGRFFLRFSPAKTTGISSADFAREVLVYPNPNNGVFTISMPAFNHEATQATLFNAVGQQVWQKTLKAENNLHIQETITLDKMAAGVYTLRLETSAGPIQRKIVIE